MIVIIMVMMWITISKNKTTMIMSSINKTINFYWKQSILNFEVGSVHSWLNTLNETGRPKGLVWVKTWVISQNVDKLKCPFSQTSPSKTLMLNTNILQSTVRYNQQY